MTDEVEKETHPAEQPKSKWKKRLFHYCLAPFNILFQGAVALCLGILFFFYAPDMRDKIIQEQTQKLIKEVTDLRFKYEGLSFKAGGDITLKSLQLYDDKGLFASATDVNIAIRLPSDHLNIQKFTADHIIIERRPDLKPRDKKTETSSGVFSKTPPMIFENIDVKKVTLKKPLLDKSSSFRLKGNINSIDNYYDLNITPLSGYKIGANIKADIQSDTKVGFKGTATLPAQLVTDLSPRIPFKNTLSVSANGSADIKDKNYITLENLIIQDKNIRLKSAGDIIVTQKGALEKLDLKTHFKEGTATTKLAIKNNIIDIETDFQNFALNDFLMETDPLKKAVLSGDMAMTLGTKTPYAKGNIRADITTNLQDKSLKDETATVLFAPHFNKNKMEFDVSTQFSGSKNKAFSGHVALDPITSFTDKTKITGGTIKLDIDPHHLPKNIRRKSPIMAQKIILNGVIKGTMGNPEFQNMNLQINDIDYAAYDSTLPRLNGMKLDAKMNISKDHMTLSNAVLGGKINNIPVHMSASGLSDFTQDQHDYALTIKDYADKAASHIALFQKNKASKLEIKGDLEKLPLAQILRPMVDIPHTILSGYYNVRLHPQNPVQSLGGTFKINSFHGFDKDHLNIHLDGDIKNAVARADMMLTSHDTHIGNGAVTYPLGPVGKHNIPASIKIETELEKLSLLTGQKMNSFSGLLNTEISLKNNNINGFLRLKNGRYTHKKLGTKLNNISANATFKENTITFHELTADDTQKGSLSLKGKLSLNDNIASDMTLTAKDFHLLNSSDLRAKTDTNLTLKGRDSKLLSGTADITDFLFLLPDLSNSAPKALNIAEEKVTENKASQTSLLDKFLQKIKIDITSNIVNTAKISGFGLDGNLGGDVKIKNTALEPKVTGMINIDRGDFELLSKEFTITKGGVFIKDNNPFFNVTAVREVGDVIITATMTGTTLDPNINFSASPSLPEDEIISYILFDGPKTSIGPIEALRITSALAALSQGKSGAGSVTDVVGNTERALGLDKINIDSDDQNNVRFGAGKYLTEKLYFSVDHGGADNDTIISLRLKLKDTLVLEGLLNPNARSQSENQSEIFLKYKKDY